MTLGHGLRDINGNYLCFQSLALCAAAVLFMMSRDRLNMDLEKSTLELMLQLLNVETNRSSPAKTPTGNNNEESRE